MYNLIFNPDHQQVLEDHNNRLKAAEHERFVREAAGPQANLYDHAVVAFGRILINLGQRLQKNHSLLRSSYLPTPQKGM